MDIENLKEQCNASIEELNKLFDSLERLGLLNEQFVLDWLDKLNEISIKV